MSTTSTPDNEGSLEEFGSVVSYDPDEASVMGQEMGQVADIGAGETIDSAAADAAAASASVVAETNTTFFNVVDGLTRQIPSEGKGGIKWAPNLVTYMGSDLGDTEVFPEGSVHLSEGSFEMSSGDGGGGVMDDFNTSPRQVTAYSQCTDRTLHTCFMELFTFYFCRVYSNNRISSAFCAPSFHSPSISFQLPTAHLTLMDLQKLPWNSKTLMLWS
jgi:hypothetical protein